MVCCIGCTQLSNSSRVLLRHFSSSFYSSIASESREEGERTECAFDGVWRFTGADQRCQQQWDCKLSSPLAVLASQSCTHHSSLSPLCHHQELMIFLPRRKLMKTSPLPASDGKFYSVPINHVDLYLSALLVDFISKLLHFLFHIYGLRSCML